VVWASIPYRRCDGYPAPHDNPAELVSGQRRVRSGSAVDYPGTELASGRGKGGAPRDRASIGAHRPKETSPMIPSAPSSPTSRT
jgi:hypothetical protein